MSTTTARHAAALVVLSEGPQQGHHLPVPAGTSILGRAEECDIRLDDPTVSRRHAQLVADAGRVLVVDLGSRCGTSVDGRPVEGAVALSPGDEVSFASVTVRVTVAPAARTGEPARQAPPRPRTSYDIDDQRAESINNVGNDQYVSYVQHVVQQRESFLAHVAATRTRARWLVWTGLVLAVVGIALYGQWVLGFLAYVFEAIQSETEPAPPDLSGLEVAGVPTFVAGFVLSAVGSLLLLVGVVLHVVATARARRVDRRLPLPGAPGHG